ncbi:MAG TPA: hypothetical protein VFN26_03860 [Candidatus Acidoferrum sp.]|nr:hypothetical protein [Candidatus Acidoferrum sp.]
MQKLSREIGLHGFVKRASILVSMVFALVPTTWPQSDPAVRGEGTRNHMAKFKDKNMIQDTAIFESKGCMSESTTVDPALGTLCLHDVTGSGATIHALSAFPDRTTFIAENDSPTGDPVGAAGVTASADRGIGLRGVAANSSGQGIAILGEEYSPGGAAGVFNAIGGGNILVGIGFNTFTAFRVDANGNVFASTYNTGGADFAESMAVTGDRSRYAAGDLLVIDSTASRHLALARQPYSTLVAGIYSTKPGIVGSTRKVDMAPPANEVPLAVVGIVPCKVTAENGPIQVGDLLVTSSTPGHGMRGTDRSKLVGAVVGKALEPLQNGKGVIQVLVTLQ